jgi:hypothetical protein
VLASLAELPSLSDAALSAMPPCVTALIKSPPAVGSWTSTVHHNALLGVIYDARYGFGGGLVAFERAAFEKSRGLLGGPLYHVIFAILRVERLMRGPNGDGASFIEAQTSCSSDTRTVIARFF